MTCSTRPGTAYRIIILVFGCRFVQTVMRMSMGSLVIYICEDFSCSPGAKGWILSAHAFGYCSTQILGGRLADKIGGRRVITATLTLAGFALATTPMAARIFGLPGVAIAQVVMGIATGPLFPASMQLLSKSLAASQRAFASTALDTGITAGSLLVIPLSSFLAMRFGWGVTIQFYGFLALGYALAWERCTYDPPEPTSSLTRVTCLEAGVSVEETPAALGACEGVRHTCLWAIYLAHFVFNYGVYFFNSWSATYYLETFAMRPEQAGVHLALPHAVNLMIKILINPALQRLLQTNGCSELICRRVFSGVGFVVPAMCFLAIPFARSPYMVTFLFCVDVGFLALHPSGFKANYMDVTVTHSGIVSGIGNTIASMASSFGPLAVAWMRESTGTWTAALNSVGIANLLAAVLFCTLSSTTPIESRRKNA